MSAAFLEHSWPVPVVAQCLMTKAYDVWPGARTAITPALQQV